jgi:xylan 1,4-beta-xylosidase
MKIKIDIDAKTMPTDYSWQEGIGADHASRFHRKDMIEQLRFVREELGIKSVRFHAIFNDDMWTISDLHAFSKMPGGDKVRDWNFRQCGDVYDNLLSVGVKPFVELSFMPSQLAKKKTYSFHYRNNVSPPRCYKEWGAYIKAFITFLLKRYGNKEVESWWFEVWNEPDLKGFFSGSKKDYFKLYEVTARAIKKVNPNIKVGGPSTSACRWIDEFMKYCLDNDVPLDFISTHHYPGDAFGNLITPANYFGIFKTMVKAVKNRSDLTDALAKMFFYPEKAARVPKDALTIMDDDLVAKVKDLPLFITEWNSMAIFTAPIHDEKYSAAFVTKSVLDLKNDFKGYMFWCLSDLFEEQIQLNKPFVGGFGILTNDGIPKPNFWAFKMLSKLFPTRLDVGFRSFGEVEYGVFKKDKALQILLTPQSNDPCLNDTHDIELSLNCNIKKATIERIDDTHANPKAEWIKLGSPHNLTHEEVETIKNKTKLKSEKLSFNSNNNETIINITMQTNDVALITLEME